MPFQFVDLLSFQFIHSYFLFKLESIFVIAAFAIENIINVYSVITITEVKKRMAAAAAAMAITISP